MGSVTPTVNVLGGFVRVEANWQDFPHARFCWIYRRVASVQVRLRDGNAAPMSNGIAVAFDHEAPLDTPITYRSSIGLNANGDMESGIAEWLDTTNGGTVGTVTSSPDYYVANEGLRSLKLVPSGAATSKAVSEFIPATAGVAYTLQGRLMVPDYWTGGVGVQIQWYNGVTPLTTVGAANDVTPAPGEWGSYGFTATAPATTTQCRIVAAITGSPPTTSVMYVDEMYLTTSGSTVSAADVVLPSDGGGWLTDPLHPATKVRLTVDLRTSDCLPMSVCVYLGVSDEEFPSDSAATAVNDSPYSIGTWNRRKAGQQSLGLGTATKLDRDQLLALHAAGAPLFLQPPLRYSEDDSYGLHGPVTLSRIARAQEKPWRTAFSTFTKQAAPIGPAEGTWGTRYVDLDKYATFAAATSAGATWLDALRGNLTA